VQVAIVLEEDGDVEVRAALLRHFLLLCRDGNAHHADLVVFGHVVSQPAPAAADIQHPHTGLKLKFTADQIQFSLLRVIESFRVFPVRAGILHIRVEHAAEQIVA